MKTKIYAILGIMAIATLGIFIDAHTPNASASTSLGSEYHATTTPALASGTMIQLAPGTFGSVVITGSNTGTMNVYDATTTPTATQLIASFPSNAATGTYTFDVSYQRGLYVTYTGSVATSTITYR